MEILFGEMLRNRCAWHARARRGHTLGASSPLPLTEAGLWHEESNLDEGTETEPEENLAEEEGVSL